MFPEWRLKIRQAQQALNQGRWDDASALLQRESVREFLPARRLSVQVANHLVDRAQKRLQSGDSVRGWQDLQQAARLGGCDDLIADVRHQHARKGLDRVRQLLIRGETKLASKQVAKLQQRKLGGDERRDWESIVHLLTQAKALARRGQAASACELLTEAEQMVPAGDDQLRQQIVSRRSESEKVAERIRSLNAELHAAVLDENWSQVLTVAESLLELAPDHSAARHARQLAWKAAGIRATLPHRGIRHQSPWQHETNLRKQNKRSTHVWASSADVETGTMKRQQGKRFVSWIDEVGGFLICLGDEVLLGQPSGTNGADIPLLADLSRRHAFIRREGEAYVLTHT